MYEEFITQKKLKEISSLVKSILYRIRYWIKVIRYIRPASMMTALGIFISMVFDIPLYLVLKSNPINLLEDYCYLKKYKTWFYVRPKTDDMCRITPGREGIIEKKFILTSLKNCILKYINNVIIVSKAAWRDSGKKLKLYIPMLPYKVRSFGLASSNKSSKFYVSKIVETIALDDLLKDYTKIKFVKIDAEGSEEKVIQGMVKALSKTAFVYIECRKANNGNIRNVLQKLGFKIIAFDVPHATHLFYIRTF